MYAIRSYYGTDYDATQRAVVGDIEGRLLISQAISNIALEGTMTPETAAEWLQEQVEALYTERHVITSYSIHYTKLYEKIILL